MEDKNTGQDTENKKTPEEIGQTDGRSGGRALFFVAIGLLCAAVAFYVVAFFAIGIYALISAILLSLASLAFLRAQKKKSDFKGVFVVTIIAYAALALSTGTFIGGLIYSAI